MKATGLCSLELRGIIEHAFLPHACVCEKAADGSFTLRIVDADSGQVVLQRGGISRDRFASSREINTLVAQLREQLRHPQRLRDHA